MTPMAPQIGGTVHRTVTMRLSSFKQSTNRAAAIEPLTTMENKINAFAFHQTPKPKRIRLSRSTVASPAVLGFEIQVTPSEMTPPMPLL